MLFSLSRRRKAKSLRVGGRKNNWEQVNLLLWGVPLLMAFISGFLIASTQRQANYADWYNHWITAALGIGTALVLGRLQVERLRPFLIPIYGLTVISLIAVRIIGTSALGAQRWISIAGVNVQPSEFAKLAAILLLAAVLDRHPVRSSVDLIRPLGVIVVPWALVFVQPDLGSSLVFGAVLLAMLYWAGMPLEWLCLVVFSLLTALFAGLIPLLLIGWIPLMGVLAYRSFSSRVLGASIIIACQGAIASMTPWLWAHGLKDYQRDRLLLFLDPSKDPLGGGYHLLQSKVGIGSGGLFGTGLLQGKLTQLQFIPEQHTDFIFSALGEEMGFLGTLLLIIGVALLMRRFLQVARNARTDFESLLVVGVGTMLMFQIVVNIFMTIGLGPVTGIPLPFMSYGRTALLMNFMSLGLCISVARRGHIISKSKNW